MRTKPGKAPGDDHISNTTIKRLPFNVVEKLVRVINGIILLGHFPSVWKHSIVVSIPKPDKDDLFPQNYRPISLISCQAKIAETVILTRLKEEVFVNNIL